MIVQSGVSGSCPLGSIEKDLILRQGLWLPELGERVKTIKYRFCEVKSTECEKTEPSVPRR